MERTGAASLHDAPAVASSLSGGWVVIAAVVWVGGCPVAYFVGVRTEHKGLPAETHRGHLDPENADRAVGYPRWPSSHGRQGRTGGRSGGRASQSGSSIARAHTDLSRREDENTGFIAQSLALGLRRVLTK